MPLVPGALAANKNGACRETAPLMDGAGDAIRTRDIFLGKEVLYH
jgi:hypothetical protein